MVSPITQKEKKDKKMTAIQEAMTREYGQGKDITKEWYSMSPKERQGVVASGLHVETDRMGRRVIANRAQWHKQEALRTLVMSKRRG